MRQQPDTYAVTEIACMDYRDNRTFVDKSEYDRLAAKIERLAKERDATIAQQAEEIERLKVQIRKDAMDALSAERQSDEIIERQSEEIDAQAEQLAAAQKDANRYRWLSSNSKHIKWIPSNYNKDVVSGFSAFNTGYLGFGFEEAIDAAIAAQEVKS